MPGPLDFIPAFQRPADVIRAAIDADVNAGLDPSDPGFIDTSEGSFYWDMTQPLVLEIERLWDALGTETLAVAFPAYAFGTYLDDHGEAIGLPRKDSANASGIVTFAGTDGTQIATGTQVGTQAATPDDEPQTYQTIAPGTIASGLADVLVEAAEAGSAGNAGSGVVTILLSPIEGVTSVTNAVALSGGADVESDEAYRARILAELSSPQGAGNVADYERWALAYPGIGNATVQPAWSGPSTVRVIVTDAGNSPVSTEVTDGLLAQLDPVPGEGRGLAPVGAQVTVASPTETSVDVTADVTFKQGYSLDGSAGSLATRADLEAALEGYLNSLPPGEDVIKQHVEAAFFQGSEGVLSVSVSEPAADVVVDGLEIARAGTIALSG